MIKLLRIVLMIMILLANFISCSGMNDGLDVGLSMCGFDGDLAYILEQELMDIVFSEDEFSDNVYKDICDGSVLSECRLSSGYGLRIHPIFHSLRLHHGIDLAAQSGAPVTVPADGIVEIAGQRGGYGSLIIIDHNYGWKSRYAHLKKINVKKGEYVRKGDLIGEVGSTGLSTGPHLHFELRYMDKTVDPRIYISMLDSFGSLLAWRTSEHDYNM